MATYLTESGEESPLLSKRRAVPAQQNGNFDQFVAAIEQSQTAVAHLAVAALQDVLSGIITGEGPTAAGRVHFSRTLDPADAALCVRIVAGAGGADGLPVTRHEAEVLFDIDAAAAERTDDGRFGDLLVKSIAHCALAEAGHKVPHRRVALAAETDLFSWANGTTGVNGEIIAWIASRLRNRRRPHATLNGVSAFLSNVGASVTLTPPPAVSFDLVA